MGFARSPAPHVIRSAEIVSFICEREIAAVFRTADPFGVDNVCERSPTGQHIPIGSCGDVVCCHCSRVFWS